MSIGRILGLTLVLTALAAAGLEGAVALDAGGYRPLPTGVLWRWLSPESLGAARDGIVGALHPALWEPGLTTVLRLPGWTLFGVPGLALLLFARTRQRRRFA